MGSCLAILWLVLLAKESKLKILEQGAGGTYPQKHRRTTGSYLKSSDKP